MLRIGFSTFRVDLRRTVHNQALWNSLIDVPMLYRNSSEVELKFENPTLCRVLGLPLPHKSAERLHGRDSE